MVRCAFLASGVVCLKAALRAMVAMVKSAIDRTEQAQLVELFMALEPPPGI